MRAFDHIIIGVGSMGSATCYHLAKRGRSVLGLEQFSTPHERGSHAGESRIVRKAYYEHPDYIPLLIRAYENWKEISERSGSRLYHQTGLFYAGPKGHPLLESIKDSARSYAIPLQQRHPSLFRLPGGYETLFEPEAGYAEPEKTIRAYVSEARKLGADIMEHVKVDQWRLDDRSQRVIVETDAGAFYCRKLVITAGAWSARLIPGIQQHLKVTRQALAWIKQHDPLPFTEGNFPCWMITTGRTEGVFYGFPITEEHPGELKMAFHYPADTTDPDHVNREISTDDTEGLLEFIDEFLPSAKGPVGCAKTCLYANSPDEHFVIDNLPAFEKHVCVAWGFSGHGFKFVPAVGEIMADLAMHHQTELPIGFLSATRFSRT